MRVLGIIPARAGSKRLPGKNMRMLGGKPLVAWAIEAARGSVRLTRLAVSSDDERVLDLAAEYDKSLRLRRPPDLATDDSPAIEYVRHALDVMEAEGEAAFDAVAIIQPSSPLTLPEDIDATVDLLERTRADSAVTVTRVPHDIHPFKFLRLEADRLSPFYGGVAEPTGAHELPATYVRNCSVYVSRVDVLREGRILGDDCRGYAMPRERSVDINDGVDLIVAESLLRQRALPARR